MKDKILMLIIGILIGAIITVACFLIFKQSPTNMQIPNGERFERNFDMNQIQEQMPMEKPQDGMMNNIENNV